MSTNPNTPDEHRALYQSMLRATRISAISALLAVLVAASAGIYSIWQTNRLLQKTSDGVEIHEIAASPTELMESLNLIRSKVMTPTTELAQPTSPQLLILEHSNLSAASNRVLQVAVSAGGPFDAFIGGDGLFVLIDGQLVPLAVPLEIQSGNTEAVYVRLLSLESSESGADDFSLESADYSDLAETMTLSPTHEINVQAASVDEAQGQTFGISFETTKGTKKIAIVMWYNY